MNRKESRQPQGWSARARALVDPAALKGLAADLRPRFDDWLRDMRTVPKVLPPYKRPTTWRGRLLWLAFLPVLFVALFIYGFFFGLTAPYFVVQCAIPIVILGALSIWALPDERVAPTRALHFWFAGFMISLCLWPSYLAISLPGLPWFTPARFFGIPLALCLLISLSISQRFRRQMSAILNSKPLVWKALATFSVMQIVTVPFSKDIAGTVNKMIIQQVYWTTIFLAACYIFSKPGRVGKYLGLFCAAVPVIFIYSYMEYMQQHVLWMEYVPSFLAVEDLEHILSPEFRFGSGVYRAKAIFSTALGLAQFVGALMPIYLYYLHVSKNVAVKLFGFSLIVMAILATFYSDSRLGYVSMLWSTLVYVFMHAFIRWRRFRMDIIASTIFYAYPAFFVTVMGASMTISSVSNAVWGGGSTAGSNQARLNQIEMAIPQVLKNPIGYGAGQSGGAMGYGAGKFVTIDNYLINIVLDYGVIGLASFLTLFIAVTSYALKSAVLDSENSKDPDVKYLIPLGVAVSAFLLIKLVFSQPDNDPLLFAMSGMIVAVLARLESEKKRNVKEPPKSDKTPPRTPRSLNQTAGRPVAAVVIKR